jgi:hypothetical protein
VTDDVTVDLGAVHVPVLKFQGGVADGEVMGWTGPWPPPARFVVLRGRQTRGLSFVGEPERLEGVAWEQHATRHVYTLRGASKLPPEHPHPNVVRGALYVPEAT